MFKYEGFHKISLKDAFSTIGLHDKNESTYYLANMIIKIESEGLEITYLGSPRSTAPEQTHFITTPFFYTHNNIEYLIANEENRLSVYEKELIISG